MKDGEWRTVCDYCLDAALTTLSYIPCAQGTALFMAGSLLTALTSMDGSRNFTFQHRLCHDLESLIWVVVYAMMIHQRNILAATDSERFKLYKKDLDECWAVHAYSNLRRCHHDMVMIGCIVDSKAKVSLWFPDPREAAFFCDAMHLILHSQIGGARITYESLCTLFRRHINLAKEPQALTLIPNEPC